MNHDGTSAQRPLCVALLFGGLSSEHEVSRVSAGTFADNMNPRNTIWSRSASPRRADGCYTEATTAQMADGSWEDLPGNMPCAISPDRSDHGAILFTPAGHVEKLYIDVVIPALHGLWGEDGTVQGLLELAGIPYVGCGVLASAVCMDKAVANALFQFYGIPHCSWLPTPKPSCRPTRRHLRSAGRKAGLAHLCQTGQRRLQRWG